MSHRLAAVLGPTNTGKTHLAVERLCAHSSGMMGFPLRLLAREIYDRVVAIKGAASVALITGEERIVPDTARWLLCTAESMPAARDVAFLALDETQLGADPERGHVFTDRLLNARGREETMILGSDSLTGVVRALTPDAEIIRRPRFSTLSYAGAKKLSRIPKRSAIVAFSAEEVYAVAEMLRRTVGGAAVVMGALSPATRNAQVAMFQSGEVDYLVATDAIGMGLNLDVAHVAFAALSKFDGKRQRRLSIAEMAQIAGRAGRHQRDGTFGTLGSADSPNAFTPEEIAAIEEHRVPRLDWLYWREGDPDTTSIAALIADLERKPDRPHLRAAPEAVDLSVLKRLAEDPVIAARATHPAQVARLWEACGLPDFRKVGADHHARLVHRVFTYLSEGNGHIPADWIASELARLDNVSGDIGQLGQRIAAVRIWAYAAERADWLEMPAHWAGRAQALEARLSDTLHKRLVERFVDRRTAALVKSIGSDPALLDVTIDAEGAVLVDDHAIGTIHGFRFQVDGRARAADRKRLLAAAERHLIRERHRRAEQLAGDSDGAFALDGEAGITWRGHRVAQLMRGPTLTAPVIKPDPAIAALPPADRDTITARLADWVQAQLQRHLSPLLAMARTASDPAVPGAVRALLAPLATSGGTVPRDRLTQQLAALDPDDRRILRQAGLTIGALDIYDGRLLRPGALRWIAALQAVRDGGTAAPDPAPGATVLGHPYPGFRRADRQWVRIDMIERVARALHDARQDRAPFLPDAALARSVGIEPASLDAIMHACGFRKAGQGAWAYRGLGRARQHKRPPHRPAAPASPHFAALAEWQAGKSPIKSSPGG